jgi:UDP-glucose 4-epimerase
MDAGAIAGLEKILGETKFDLSISCTAMGGIGRSFAFPLPYYHNNFLTTYYLLQTLLKFRVRKFLYLSDFSVYGRAPRCPIDSSSVKSPDSPLGRSLCAVESLLFDLAENCGLEYAILRFGIAGGALAKGPAGPLLPDGARRFLSAVFAVALGSSAVLPIFGNTLPTRDGTPLRDPIHVVDVADAVVKAAHEVMGRSGGREFVLGSGAPLTVGEWARAVETVVGREIPTEPVEPKPFDAPALYGDPREASSALGWRARSDLRQIIEDEWRLIRK